MYQCVVYNNNGDILVSSRIIKRENYPDKDIELIAVLEFKALKTLYPLNWIIMNLEINDRMLDIEDKLPTPGELFDYINETYPPYEPQEYFQSNAKHQNEERRKLKPIVKENLTDLEN